MLASSLCVLLLLQNTPRPPAAPPAGSTPAAGDPTADRAPVFRGPIPGLVAEGSLPVQIATGFRFTEGPAADAAGELYFVDVPSSRVLHLTSQRMTAEGAGENFTDYVVNNGACFGLMFAADGRLFATQGGSKGGALLEIDRSTRKLTPLAQALTVDNASLPLGRVNDLAVDADGGIYFTDPSLGRVPSPTRGILYRAKDGTLTRVDTTVDAPNGVRLSADGKHLFALSYSDPGIYRFDVTAPGTLAAPKKIGELLGPDGIRPRGRGDGFAIDERGNLWCTNPDVSEIQVVNPEGTVIGRIAFPEAPSNCAFGGADGKTLFVTALTSVYALRTEVAGYWIARRPAASAPSAPAPAAPSATPSPTTAPQPAVR